MSRTTYAALCLALAAAACGTAEETTSSTFHEVTVGDRAKVTTTGAVARVMALEDDAGAPRGYAIYTEADSRLLRHEVVALDDGPPVDSIEFTFDGARASVRPMIARADGDPPQAHHAENGWAIGPSGGMFGFGIEIKWTPSGSDLSTFRFGVQTPVSEHSYTHSFREDWYQVRDAAISTYNFYSAARTWAEGTDSPMAFAQAFFNYIHTPTPTCQPNGGGGSGGGSGSSGGCH